MEINDLVLETSEKFLFTLRGLYQAYGYKPYKMSKFEEYDLYAKNKDFLVSDNVITFTDTSGKLMALKPDVTLSIIKNREDQTEYTEKIYYNENVYRVAKGTGSFKEILQAGVECIGKVSLNEIGESLDLAVRSLLILSSEGYLSISNLDILSQLIDYLELDSLETKAIYKAIEGNNIQEIDRICQGTFNEKALRILKELLKLHLPVKDAIPVLDELLSDLKGDAYKNFRALLTKLQDKETASYMLIDFSVTGDINYYNGTVFKGYINGVPSSVLSGGQYDRLMRKLNRKACAIGFAVYTDQLERLEDPKTLIPQKDDRYLNIALPKGRLGEKVYELLAKAGFECTDLLSPNRKLIFENPDKKVRYFWVKPSDVAIYVERGAADLGICGKDILEEYEPEVYELLDLKCGRCKMCVAGLEDFSDDPNKTLRVATKFSKIAKEYYQKQGRDIDIIYLNGSIEIAPLLKLSDVIVDIVETGATLKENHLEVKEEVLPITARLISNKAAYKFNREEIDRIIEGLTKVLEEVK